MENINPWLVENVQAFAFLNCPECPFKEKELAVFQDHALRNHPQSSVLFDSKINVEEIPLSNIITFDNSENLENITYETVSTQNQIILQDPSIILKDASNEQIEVIVKVLDEQPQLPPTTIRQTNYLYKSEPLTESDHKNKILSGFQGSRKKTKQSVDALIDVLNELSDDKYKCVMCDEMFSDTKLMRNHCKEAHGDKDGNIVCPFCDKKFTELFRFNKHFKERHIEKPKEACKICGKVIQAGIMKRHMKVAHTDRTKKIYKCELCDFRTHTKVYIGNHMTNKHTYIKTGKDYRRSQYYRSTLVHE